MRISQGQYIETNQCEKVWIKIMDAPEYTLCHNDEMHHKSTITLLLCKQLSSLNTICSQTGYTILYLFFRGNIIYMIFFLPLPASRNVLPPIGNKYRQFYTSLVQSLYYVPDSYFWSEGVEKIYHSLELCPLSLFGSTRRYIAFNNSCFFCRHT
jgi:hypothetical protein